MHESLRFQLPFSCVILYLPLLLVLTGFFFGKIYYPIHCFSYQFVFHLEPKVDTGLRKRKNSSDEKDREKQVVTCCF